MLKTSEKAEVGLMTTSLGSRCKKKNPNTKENGGRLNKNRKKRFEMKIEDKVLQTCCF